MNESYKYIPGAVSCIIVFFYVAVVLLIELFTGRERFCPSRLICLALSVSGLLAVIFTPSGSEPLHIIGILFSVIAAVFYALQCLGMGARRVKSVNPVVITAYMTVAPISANTIRCYTSGQPFFPGNIDSWVCVIVLGAGAAFIAPVCYCKAVKTIGASDTALVNTSEPIVAYMAGIIIMSDHISWNATLGGILTMSSVIILNICAKIKGNIDETEVFGK